MHRDRSLFATHLQPHACRFGGALEHPNVAVLGRPNVAVLGRPNVVVRQSRSADLQVQKQGTSYYKTTRSMGFPLPQFGCVQNEQIAVVQIDDMRGATFAVAHRFYSMKDAPPASRLSIDTRQEKTKTPSTSCWGFQEIFRRRPTLPGGLPPSTIGAGELNFRVRDGNGCIPAAMATGNLFCPR